MTCMRLLSPCFAIALAVVPWRLAGAVAPEAASNQVNLVVDVSELEGEHEALESYVAEAMGEALSGAGHQLADSSAITLQIRFRDMEQGDQNYGIHFEFIVDGETKTAIEWVDCVFCSQFRLQKKLDEATPGLLEALKSEQDRVAASASTHSDEDGGDFEESDAEESGGEDSDDGSQERPKPIGALGISGAVGLVVGVGLTAGGAVELARGRVPEDGNGQTSMGVDHTTPGAILVGVGAAAIVAGAVMLGVDVSKRKKTRGAQVLVVPILGPAAPGVGVVGRF